MNTSMPMSAKVKNPYYRFSCLHLTYCAGREVLPTTYVNGKIEKVEECPTEKEVYSLLSNV
jgi:hypothetical protein